MAITLAQAKVTVPDALSQLVIDEFRKSSFLLDKLSFDDAVSPVGGGATLTYGYTRVITESTAAFRALNSEYTPQHATKQKYTCDLKVFGGAYEIDRVIAGLGGIQGEVSFQMAQKIKGARALFHDTVVNGDSGVDANAFDGLDKAITGSSTELIPNSGTTGYFSLKDETDMEANKWLFLDLLDEFISKLDGCDALMMNDKMLLKVISIARRAGYFSREKNEFGQPVDMYRNIPLVDLGAKPASTDPVVPIETRDADGAGAGGNITNLTDIYGARFAIDGFHGVSMAGQPPIRQWLPDFKTAGAVKKGEVEMVAAVALKATKAAGALRNIKIGA